MDIFFINFFCEILLCNLNNNHMSSNKKLLLKKIQKYRKLHQNSYINNYMVLFI